MGYYISIIKEGLNDYMAIIKEGMAVANRNWQLIVVQFMFMFLSFIGMLIIVGIPLAIAFIIFGVDLTEMLRQPGLFGFFRVAGEMLSKSPLIVLFVTLSFVLNFAFFVTMFIFFLSGTFGLIAKSVRTDQKFSLSIFWAEAKRLFFPVLLYSLITFLSLILYTMIMGILSEIVNQLVLFTETSWPEFGAFINIFFGLVLWVTGLLIFLLMMGITFYGFGYLVFNRPRPFRGIKQTVIYMYKNPSSLLLLFIMALLFMAVFFVISMVSIFSASIPFVGAILALPFNFISQAALWYVIIVIFASLFLYYYRTGYQPSSPASSSDQDIA
jgi:hypothetical protein